MRSIFRHRCLIERDAAVKDEFGAEVAADWQPHVEDQPCRYWQRDARGDPEATNAGRTVVVEDIKLFVPLSTDVTAADRIGAVTNRLGAVIAEGPLRIDSVGIKPKFKELLLRSGS